MKEINPNWCPRIRPDILTESIEDEMVVFVPETDQTHLLNLTAAAIFELCDGAMTVKDIIKTLKESVNETPEGMKEEIYKTLSEYIEKGLLEQDC